MKDSGKGQQGLSFPQPAARKIDPANASSSIPIKKDASTEAASPPKISAAGSQASPFCLSDDDDDDDDDVVRPSKRHRVARSTFTYQDSDTEPGGDELIDDIEKEIDFSDDDLKAIKHDSQVTSEDTVAGFFIKTPHSDELLMRVLNHISEDEKRGYQPVIERNGGIDKSGIEAVARILHKPARASAYALFNSDDR
jgi:hypothetical protein